MERNPLFSIITITFNAETTIPATLACVKAQTCTDFEYIVIDGNSTDNTVPLAQSAKISGTTIISEPDKGLYDAMNKGLRLAKGEFVIFLNAGDSFHNSDSLQIAADAISQNPDADIFYGQTDIVNADRVKIADRHLTAPDILTADSFKNGMLVCHQAFIARRAITEPYNLKYRFSADFDWCIRCLKKSRKNVYLGCTLIDYLSEGVTTANFKKSLRERYDIMCDYYGTIPTTLRHIHFLARHLLRKL